MMLRRFMVGMATVVLLIAASASGGLAAPEKLLLVVIDKVTWGDLLADDVDAPTLRRLAEEGAPGLMSVRSGRGPGGAYLTIGAGSRAGARLDPVTRTSVEANAYQSSETVGTTTAGRLFRSRTGWPAGDNPVVHLAIGALIRQNEDAPYPLQLGLLGGALRRAGLKVACVGNADTADAQRREVVAIAMDEQGLVGLGDVGRGLARHDPTAPAGVAADPDRLLAALRGVAAEADLIVLDIGETSRVEAAAESMTESALRAARGRAIASTDRLLARALALLPAQDWAVLVVTPSLRTAAKNESLSGLTPAIWWAEGAPLRALSSPSTRRQGIVASIDIAPTVLDFLGVAIPPAVVGRPLSFDPAPGHPLDAVASMDVRLTAAEAARPVLFRAIPVTGAVALWIGALCLLLGDRAPRSLRSLARGALVLVMSAPPAMLLVTLRPMPSQEMLLAAAGLSLTIALLSGLLTGWRSGHVIPAFLTVGILIYDLASGQRMLHWSPFSYSPAAGARFYGLGNEFGGALLGAGLIVAAAIAPRDAAAKTGERLLAGLLLLGLAMFVGLPRFGANVGMSLSTGIAAAALIVYLWRRDAGWPEGVAAAALALALVAAAIAADVLVRGADTSHIGRFAGSVRADGWSAVLAVLWRKVAMNWLLVQVSLWTDAAVAGVAVLAVGVLARPAGLVAAARERIWLSPATVAGVAGAASAFALNDSGIVAAAVALTYTAGALAYLALGDAGARSPAS